MGDLAHLVETRALLSDETLPIGLAGRRLSRSAKVSSASSFQRLRHIQWYVAAALLLQALACAVQQKRRPALSSQGLIVANACVACKHACPQGAPPLKGTWCSGITSASHAEGPGLNPQCVHSIASVLEWSSMAPA